jgi:hypothetical protein
MTGAGTGSAWVTSMTSKHYVGVSFRVWHPIQTPRAISESLDRQPSHSAGIGSPKGRARGVATVAKWADNYWCYDFEVGQSLEDGLATVAAFLSSKGSQIKELLRSGGRADLYLFLAPTAVEGFEMEPGLLTTLGRLGVRLGVEVIAPRRP